MDQQGLNRMRESLLLEFDEETVEKILKSVKEKTAPKDDSAKSEESEKVEQQLKSFFNNVSLKDADLTEELQDSDRQNIRENIGDFKSTTLYSKDDAEFSARKIKALENLYYSKYERDPSLLINEFLTDGTITQEQLDQIVEYRKKGIVFVISHETSLCFSLIKAILDYEKVVLKPQEISKLEFYYTREMNGEDVSNLEYRIVADTREDLTDKKSIAQEYELFNDTITISAFVFLDTEDGNNYKVVSVLEK
jgi:hypothetical protein